MNKMIFTMLLAFSCITSFAKDGFYMGASIGFGRARQNLKEPQSAVIFNDTYRFRSTQAFQASVDVGYRLHNFRFAGGIQYLQDGYELVTHSLSGRETYEQIRFGHVNVPLRAGYNINILKRLAIVPYVGASVGYNRNPVVVSKFNGEKIKEYPKNRDFEWEGYRRVSFMAMGQVDVRYQLCDVMAITLGPRYSYQVGSIQQFDKNKGHIEPMKLNSLVINLGIEISTPGFHHGAMKDRTNANGPQ